MGSSQWVHAWEGIDCAPACLSVNLCWLTLDLLSPSSWLQTAFEGTQDFSCRCRKESCTSLLGHGEVQLDLARSTSSGPPTLQCPPAAWAGGGLAGSVWQHSSSPPNSALSTCRSQILGKGRYGWVLLGRYRGTSVCVKRLLPRSACKLASIFDTDGPIDAAPVTLVPDAVAASMLSGSRVAPRRKSSMRPTDGSPHGELVGRVKSVLAQPLPPLLSPTASLALPDAENNFVLPAEPSSRDAQRWQHLPFVR